MSEKHIGEVVQVIGPVLDIRFAHDELPALLNAIEIESNGAKGHEGSGYRRPDHSSGRRCLPGTSI